MSTGFEASGSTAVNVQSAASAILISPAEAAIDEARGQVIEWIRASRSEADPEPTSGLVIQYTALATLTAMLPPGGPNLRGPTEIWASAAPHMNDIREFSFGQEKVMEALRSHQAISQSDLEAKDLLLDVAQSAKGEDLYCACFSAKEDDLGQWRGYGDDGRGCCVVYDREQLQQDHSWLSGWVIYDPQTQDTVAKQLAVQLISRISRYMPHGTAASFPSEARRALARLVPSTFVFFKDFAFREEQEFRLVYAPLADARSLPVFFQERRGRIVPYVKLPFEDGAPLRQIWMGPRNDLNRTRPAFEHLVKERGLRHIQIVKSNIPYLP